jgi:NADH:ubiquinone oxidoreductase subunit C
VNAEPLLTALRSRLPSVAARLVGGELELRCEANELRGLLRVLRDELRFDHLPFLTALDRPVDGRLELVYRLFSYASKAAAMVRVMQPREQARVPTVSDLYRTAEWHEREAAELFGITFLDHPDPRRLLLPDELEGCPLRKDFTHPNLRPLPEAG